MAGPSTLPFHIHSDEPSDLSHLKENKTINHDSSAGCSGCTFRGHVPRETGHVKTSEWGGLSYSAISLTAKHLSKETHFLRCLISREVCKV